MTRGGTKTVCLLANRDGAVVGESRGAGANLQTAGELEVEKVLHDVMERATGESQIVPAAICLGIAGVDREQDAAAVRGIMRRIGFKARTLVVNDALIALVAGAGDSAGMVIVAGTGSIAYGHDGAGHGARAGGWGYLLGDEGSGFWIGRLALSAVVRQADGRGPATRLTDLILRYMSLSHAGDLIHETYDRDLRRQAIAALAPLVQEAQTTGDPVAADIPQRAATELVAAGTSVIAQLDMRGAAFPVVLAVGIFRVVPWLAAEVGRRLVELAPRSRAELLKAEPAVGAVQLALAEARGDAMLPTYTT